MKLQLSVCCENYSTVCGLKMQEIKSLKQSFVKDRGSIWIVNIYLYVFDSKPHPWEAGYVYGKACHSGHQKPAGQDL